jgi:hypothetical protein
MNSIQILLVSNGYLVILPQNSHNPYDATAMAMAIAKGTSQSPTELQRESDNAKKELPRDENTFIFDSFEKVLAFLADKYI